MKAIQMAEHGGPEVLQYVDLPDAEAGPGEILIRVASAGVNFSDVMRRRGDDYPDPTPLPFVPGAEVSGTVAALGEGVDGPEVGTPVFGVVGQDASGGYAELARAFAPNVIPIPPGLDADAAATIVITGLSATMILADTARLAEGESVFVPAAAGSLGTYAVQIAKLLGAGTVVAGASTPEKREIALSHGADHAIDYRQNGWVDAVRDVTGGRGVDVAIDIIGGARLGESLDILAPFGRLVAVGAVGAESAQINEAQMRRFVADPAAIQSLIGFNMGIWFAERPQAAVASLQRVVGWVAAGDITTPQTDALPLAEAAEAHRRLETGATKGKLVLKP